MTYYGCHNRKPLRESRHVRDGWAYDQRGRFIVAHQTMTEIPDPMTKGCQYTHTDLGRVDPKCEECMHKAIEQKCSDGACTPEKPSA